MNSFGLKNRWAVLGFLNELCASGEPKTRRCGAKAAAQTEFGEAWNLILVNDVLTETFESINVSMDLAGRENSTQSSKGCVDCWARIFHKKNVGGAKVP